MSDRRIRFAALDDASLIAAMAVEFEAYIWSIVGRKKHKPVAVVQKRLHRAMSSTPPACQIILAEQRKEALGYLLFTGSFDPMQNKPMLFVSALFVRQGGVQSQGVGKALLMAARAEARRRGCDCLTLNVWNRNSKALGFYLALGIKPVGDELSMLWKLTRRVSLPD